MRLLIECYTSFVHDDNNALSTSECRPAVLSGVPCNMPKILAERHTTARKTKSSAVRRLYEGIITSSAHSAPHCFPM
jgi:hypothetical protein